jgi:hypothetical protein
VLPDATMTGDVFDPDVVYLWELIWTDVSRHSELSFSHCAAVLVPLRMLLVIVAHAALTRSAGVRSSTACLARQRSSLAEL